MSNQVTPVPEGFHTVTPTITVKNSIEAIEFYQQAFNAENLGAYPGYDAVSSFYSQHAADSIITMPEESIFLICT
jgi:uncharacterized glyoxalase superfamily protein PhnB